MSKSSNLFAIIDQYVADLFVPPDEALESALAEAKSAGLPDIQVSPTQGKCLYLLAKLMGARRILEIGTLGGYSTLWLARALPEGGRVVTLELESAHAEIAAANLKRAGLAAKVEIVVGPALETLPRVCGAGQPFDLVFIDADKENYCRYFTQVMTAVHSGSLILADNVVRNGAVLAPPRDDSAAQATRAFNAMIAADPRLEAVVLQQVGVKGHDGMALARVR